MAPPLINLATLSAWGIGYGELNKLKKRLFFEPCFDRPSRLRIQREFSVFYGVFKFHRDLQIRLTFWILYDHLLRNVKTTDVTHLISDFVGPIYL
jgi:hypothetical protein